MTTSEGGLRRYAFPIGLAAAGVVAGAVLASGMAANADSTPSPSAGARTAETPVTDTAVAGKIKAAVLAKYPGATFDAVENAGAGYEAEIVTKAGTKLHVDVSKAFVVTERQGRGPGGPGGPGGDRTETPVTDTAVAGKIKAAVLAKYPGATFDAVENAGAGYEA
ncbi:MAG: hypothetical protein QOG99_1725, partial [Frankiales bacterium]|nr:hypothetical protein [Frankiales bacterium]